jgi:hypothetical protein
MWEHVGIYARAADADGIPSFTDPWPAKDVSRFHSKHLEALI